MIAFPKLSGDCACDLDALREYLADRQPPNVYSLALVLDATIAILADLQRKQAEIEWRLSPSAQTGGQP